MIHKNAQNGHVLITMSVFVIYLIYYIYKGLGTYESETYQIRLSAVFFHEPVTRHKLICVTLALIGCVLVSGVLESNGLS